MHMIGFTKEEINELEKLLFQKVIEETDRQDEKLQLYREIHKKILDAWLSD